MRKYQEHLFVALSLLVILIILFNKVIISDNVFVSGDTLAPQAFKQSIQNIKNQYDSYSYWFPYIFSGMPSIHSFIGISDFYFPHKVISFFHNYGMPWIWNFMFHYIFAGVGMYLFLRYLKQNKLASFFGASLFMICPYMVAYFVFGHGSQVMTAAYMPWIILYLFKIFDKSNLINFSILSLLIGLQLQRGHIQIAYYTWMLIGLYIIIKLVYSLFINKNSNLLVVIKKNFFILLSLFIGLLLSMNIYYPVMNYTDNSVRGASEGGYGIQQATSWSLNFNEIITFINPYYYGFGGTTYWGYLQFTDFANYIGIIILLLAVIGFYKSSLRNSYKIFFLLSILFSLTLSTGKYSLFIYEFFYNFLPYFDKFRAPIYFLIIFYFSVITLSSIGLSIFISHLKNKRYFNYYISFFTLLLTFLFLEKTIDYKSSHISFITKTTSKSEINFDQIKNTLMEIIQPILKESDGINLIDFSNMFSDERKMLYFYFSIVSDHNNDGSIDIHDIKEINSSYLYNQIEIINKKVNLMDHSINKDLNIQILITFLLLVIIVIYHKYSFIKQNHLYIIFIFSMLYDYTRINYDIISPSNHQPHKNILKKKKYLDDFLNEDPLIKYLKLNNSEPYRIFDLTLSNKNRWSAFNIENIDGYHPAKLSLYNNLLESKNLMNYNFNNLNLLNVKYIISDKILSENHEKLQMNYFGRKYWIDGQKTNIYLHELNNINPRLFFVDKVSFYNSNNVDIFQLITKSGFNASKESYVDSVHLSTTIIKDIKNISYDSEALIEIKEWSNDRIVFTTTTTTPQFLFLSEIYYPGWETNINNEIIKTNGLFRGLIIPEGENEISLQFKPNDITYGKWIHMISLFIILFLLFLGIRNKKQYV